MPFRLGRFDRLTMKRVFVIFGLIFILFFSFAATTSSFARPVYAASNPTYAAVDPAYAWIGEGVWDNIRDRISGLWQKISCATDVACWVRQATTSALNYGIYSLVGTDVLEIAEASTPAEAFADGYGLLGGLATIAGGIYETPPNIHLAGFFKKELSENLLASPTYATFGTELLDPIQESWAVVRNLAYALFVVIVGAIALMIILQKQLPPREVVTVTHALPKIFFSLILITLSFPIAALFVDLFVVWLPQVLYNNVFTPPVDPTVDPAGLFLDPMHTPFSFLFGSGAIQFILGVLKIASSAGVGAALGTLAALILLLIIAIAAIAVVGLIVLQLLYRYARILILTIFAPLLLLLGALPGKEEAISSWFKDLAVQTLVFPGILVVVFIAFSVLNATSYLPITKLGEIPGVGPIFMGGPIPSLSGSIICLILLLMSFKVPGLIESAVKGKGRR